MAPQKGSIPDITSNDPETVTSIETSNKQNLSEFVSISGVQTICDRKSSFFRRLLWLVVLACSSTWMLFNFYTRGSIYFGKPKNVNMEFSYTGSVNFPVVTICNLNNYRSVEAYHFCGTDPDCFGTQFPSIYDRWYDVSNPKLYEVINDFTTVMQALAEGREDELARKQMLEYDFDAAATNTDFNEFYRKLSHRKDVMILGCTWKGTSCSEDNFTDVHTDSGLCFSFNSDNSSANLMTETAGAAGGLSLLLDVEQYFYMRGTSLSGGVKVLIQHHDEARELVKNMAYSVSAGFHTSIALRYNKYDELPEPGDTCDTEISLSKCILNCTSEYVIQRCECREIYMTGTASVCSPEQLVTCSATATVALTSNLTAKQQCKCIPGCKRNTPLATLSQAKFSRHMANIFAIQNAAPPWLKDTCKLQAWASLDISNRTYTKDIAAHSLAMHSLHTTLVSMLSKATTLVSLNHTYQQHDSEALTTTDWESFIGNASVLMVHLNDTLTNITSNDLYSFVYTDNQVKVNYRIAIAFDIVYKQQLFISLHSSLDEGILQSVVMLDDLSRAFDVVELQCIESNSSFCVNVLNGIKSIVSSLTNDIDNCVVQLEESLHIYNNTYQQVASDHRLNTISCVEDAQEFYTDNYLKVDIYFEELGEFQLTQHRSDTVNSLICDFGGTLGLCLGGSILTLIEITELIYYALTSYINNKVTTVT